MAEITITAPMIITPRLLPGVKIGDGMLSVEIDGIDPADGKPVVTYMIDFAGESPVRRLGYVGNDIRLSPMTANLSPSEQYRAAVGCVLSFLSHAAETYRGRMGDGGDGDAVFNPAVDEWAYLMSDEIDILCCEVGDEF